MNTRPLLPADTVTPVNVSPIIKRKACVQCRSRKVKCDKKSPCTNCSAWSLDCVFPSPFRSCNRPRTRPKELVAEQGPKDSQTLKERVRQLEETLSLLTGSVEGSRNALANRSGHNGVLGAVANSGRGGETMEAVNARNGETVADTTFFGVEPYWNTPTSFSNVFNHCTQAMPGSISSRYQPERLSPVKTFALERSVLRPPLQRAQICWPSFLENVDPLVKVLHRPSAQHVIRKAVHQKPMLSKGEQALLHAICFSTISSMTIEDAEHCFEMPKAAALATYRSTTEQVLMEANFLITDDLVTLQALVLFLWFCPYVDEAKLAWSLTGTAARLSSVGPSMSPFEKEMRRRLLWHLWYLDNRAKQDLGRDSFTSVCTVDLELPLNVDDKDLDPNMAMLPTPRSGWMAVSFSLIRFEIAISNNKLDSDIPIQQKEEMINDIEQKLTSTYLHYRGVRKPIHWLAEHVTHVHITEMWFKLYGLLPNSPTASPHIRATRDRLFLAAIDIVDMARDHGLEPEVQRWKWLVKGYHQYLPLAFILTELCHREDSDLVARAWKVVERAYLRWGEDIQHSKHETVLTQLMEKAKAQRSLNRHMQALESYLPVNNLENLPMLPETNGSAPINPPTVHSVNDLPTFLVDEMQLNSTDMPLFNEDIPMMASSEYVADFAPDAFDAASWSDLAPCYNTLDGGLEDFELRDVLPS
jgi:hypothetical protein